MKGINPRPGVVVCTCTAVGRIDLHEPDAYMRWLYETYGQARAASNQGTRGGKRDERNAHRA